MDYIEGSFCFYWGWLGEGADRPMRSGQCIRDLVLLFGQVGGITGAFSAVVMYPVDCVRIRIMCAAFIEFVFKLRWRDRDSLVPSSGPLEERPLIWDTEYYSQ